jgi:hypothetical protein
MIRRVWQALWGEDPANGRRVRANEFRVLCPYHKDSNASCDVSFDKDVFKCRSCGSGGGWTDAIIQAGDASDRHEAFKWAERRGLI